MVSKTLFVVFAVLLMATTVTAKSGEKRESKEKHESKHETHEKTFYYETRYAKKSKESTSVQVGESKELRDHSVSKFVYFDRTEGYQTLYSYYHKKDGTHAVVVDHKKKEIRVVIKKTTRVVKYKFEKKKWHHFCLTRNSKTGDTIIYINGKQVEKLANFEKDFYIRKDSSYVLAQYQTDKREYKKSYQFSGRITETNVHSQVLTSKQVRTLSRKEELKSSETRIVYSWEKSYAQDGMASIQKSTLRTEECSVSSSSSSSEESSEEDDEDDEETSTCSTSYDIYYSKDSVKSAAYPQHAEVKKDLTEFTYSAWTYHDEDVSKESTVISYVTENEEDTVSIGQKDGFVLVVVGRKTYRCDKQKTKIKSKNWYRYTAVWSSKTGVLDVYLGKTKVQSFENVKKHQKIGKGGSHCVGQKQTKRNEFDKESRHVGRITHTHIDSRAFSEKEVVRSSKKTTIVKSTKTTIVSASSSYQYSGLCQVRESSLREKRRDESDEDDDDHDD